VWLVLALVLGLVRFLRLGEWSLWIDEVYTLHDAWSLAALELDQWPENPVGYWLMAFWIDAVGGWPDELTLRILPALFGWLAIGLTAWAFAPCLGRRRAGLAALLIAISSWHVYWSQNARFYTLAMDLSLLGGGWLLRGLFAPGQRRRALAIIAGLVTSILAALAHPSALLLLPAWLLSAAAMPWLGGTLDAHGRRGRGTLLLACGLGSLAAAPWGWRVVTNYGSVKGLDTWTAGVAHLVLSTGFFVTPVLLAAAAAGAWTAWRRGALADRVVTVLVCCAFGLALVISTAVKASAQYVFVVLPWVAWLAVLPFESAPGEAPRRWTPARVLGMSVLLLPALVDCGLYFGHRYGDRPRWREAYRYVWNQRGPEDVVFGALAPVGEYYLGPGRRELRQPLTICKLDRYEHFAERHWARQGRRAWFIVNRELLQDWDREDRAGFEEMLAGQCRLAREFKVPSLARDLDVLVYVRE
jgi:hypothetical protein